MILAKIWLALKAGEELADSTAWKNRQATANAVAAILGLVVALLALMGVQVEVSSTDIAALAGGIAVVLGLLNTVFTAATSKRVGLPSVNKDEPVAGVGD